MGGDHDAAVRMVLQTALLISDRCAQILVEMRRGWRGGKRPPTAAGQGIEPAPPVC